MLEWCCSRQPDTSCGASSLPQWCQHRRINQAVGPIFPPSFVYRVGKLWRSQVFITDGHVVVDRIASCSSSVWQNPAGPRSELLLSLPSSTGSLGTGSRCRSTPRVNSSLYDDSICAVGSAMATQSFFVDVSVVPAHDNRYIGLDVGRCADGTIFN